MLSRITYVEITYNIQLITDKYKIFSDTLFGGVKDSLTKLTVQPTGLGSPPDFIRLLEQLTQHNFPHLCSLTILFSNDIAQNDLVLSLVEKVAPTLTKFTLASVNNSRTASFDIAIWLKDIVTKFFNRMFNLLSAPNNRLQSINIRKLYVGDLASFLRGLFKLGHIKKLKLPSLLNYSQEEIDCFNSGLIDFVKSHQLTIVSTPFGVGADLLAAILSKPTLYYLRIMPLAMTKLPDTLTKLSIREEVSPSVFTTFITTNSTHNLVRLYLFDHKNYLNADNFEPFINFLRTSKTLSTLFLGDYLYITDEQKETLIPVVINDTSINSILIGMTEPEDIDIDLNDEEAIEARTTKEFDDLQFLFNQLSLNPVSSLDNVHFEITDEELFLKMMVDRSLNTGSFIGHYDSYEWSMKFHRVVQS
ncbi:hypothetical protein SAMD00019534_030480 [Acytostelium subglobosum LB1]|uniref:hypothetical protein n=1 Tax=Acytostelium subglobosum LB1 TaxID=1410327 RepID=UPI000644C3EC|nr:hypothetical protein SAMD00019534_030480 [Acytostelium subglobosum LB1]GAM19873.1 hypothetical protein SAMD00019534_030480 [Acytostelium subglobosum LB1]|eukprot:XP_012756635.1 hypothetical protein SAMD00019534_030480 [Acytostelium subglobosum LB1]